MKQLRCSICGDTLFFGTSHLCDIHRLKELRDEIGRLREELRLREASQIPVIPEAAQAEIEQLRFERDQARGEVYRRGAEVERLRDQLSKEWRNDLRAEVERLRVDRDEWKANGEHWRAAIPALEVEIERLQDKLDRIEGAKYE